MPVPIPQPQAVSVPYMAAAAQRQQMAMASEAAIRRSKKPTDKNLPEGIEDVVIGEGVEQYKNMRELEKRLDAAVVRKRLDIQDSVSKTVKKYRTMRIWISNTVENQPWQQQSGQDGSVVTGMSPGSGRFKVKIEGRLLDNNTDSAEFDDDEDDDDGDEGENGKDGNDNNSKRPKQRFSHFFKSVTVDFDKPSMSRPEDFKPIVWNKPLPASSTSLPPGSDFDSLEFSRPSQENLNVTISLVRDETPERFKLSKELADVLDVDEEDRSGIVLGIWDYIRAMDLQGDEEKRLVRCDDRLRAVCILLLLLFLLTHNINNDHNK